MELNDMKEVNRRSVLKSVGGTGSSLFLLNDAPTAEATVDKDSDPHPVVKKHENKRAVSQAIQSEGMKIVDGLAERSLIAEPSVSALPLETFIDDTEILSATDKREGFAVSWIDADVGPTAHITVSINTADHDVALVIQPEAKKAHAFIAPTKDKDKQLLTTNDNGEVSTMSICHTYEECSDEVCYCSGTAAYYYLYHYECYSGVNSSCTDNCEVVDKTCPDDCYCSVCEC